MPVRLAEPVPHSAASGGHTFAQPALNHRQAAPEISGPEVSGLEIAAPAHLTTASRAPADTPVPSIAHQVEAPTQPASTSPAGAALPSPEGPEAVAQGSSDVSAPAIDPRPQSTSSQNLEVPPEPRSDDVEQLISAPSEPAMELRPSQPRLAPRRVNPYLSNDPAQKARRLARALVSDLVAYNPQKREEGLRAGTLKELFRDEIRKSWQEYAEQVGTTIAESTPHFQDALNDILAGGRRIF